MYTEPGMETALTTADRYNEVRSRIARAAERSGRRAEDVLLVAVTKYAEMDQVRELMALGHQDFGESRAQQLIQRAAMVEELIGRRKTMPGVSSANTPSGSPSGAGGRLSAVAGGLADPAARLPESVRWHMIGHLQRNKVKKLMGQVRLIHSVDSLRLVEEIQTIAFKRDEPVECLVQVNTSGEKSKYGCAVAAAMPLCEQIDTMIHLNVRGLMTMAPYSENPEDARSTFERCAELFEEIRTRGIGEGQFNILSMGMTNDFEVGIECGSNMVRVGTALFGERNASDEHSETDED